MNTTMYKLKTFGIFRETQKYSHRHHYFICIGLVCKTFSTNSYYSAIGENYFYNFLKNALKLHAYVLRLLSVVLRPSHIHAIQCVLYIHVTWYCLSLPLTMMCRLFLYWFSQGMSYAIIILHGTFLLTVFIIHTSRCLLYIIPGITRI